MTKKIGKIIMITAIVVFIVGIVGTLTYNIVEFTKGAKKNEKWYKEESYYSDNSQYYECYDSFCDKYIDSDDLHDEYQKHYKKLISKHLTELLIEIVASYFSYILLCGYGRLVQDNYEKTQAAKELNQILLDRNKQKTENNQEATEKQTINEAD